jgi:hypothetical protein
VVLPRRRGHREQPARDRTWLRRSAARNRRGSTRHSPGSRLFRRKWSSAPSDQSFAARARIHAACVSRRRSFVAMTSYFVNRPIASSSNPHALSDARSGSGIRLLPDLFGAFRYPIGSGRSIGPVQVRRAYRRACGASSRPDCTQFGRGSKILPLPTMVQDRIPTW